MVYNADTVPSDMRDVLLILGPSPYTDMVVGYYSPIDGWRERSTDGKHDGDLIKETKDCYVAGWMDLPDIELWKDQLIGEYEWRRNHADDND